MLNKSSCLFLTVVLFVTSASATPKSVFLVGTSLQTGSASGYIISSSQAIAQKFVLTVNAKSPSLSFVVGGSYTYVDLGAAGFGSDVPFLAQLTDGLGAGSAVIAQQQFTFAAQPFSYYAAVFSFEGSKKLPPGVYYLILSTRNTNDIGTLTWWPESEIISAFGHLGNAYCADPSTYNNPKDAVFSPCTTPQTMQFQLVGR